jgi:hypothetical protein
MAGRIEVLFSVSVRQVLFDIVERRREA